MLNRHKVEINENKESIQNIYNTSLTLESDLYIKGQLDVSGISTFNNNVTITNNLAVNGSMNISGLSNLNNLYVSGTLHASNDVTLYSSVVVHKSSTFESNLTIKGELNVLGDANFVTKTNSIVENPIFILSVGNESDLLDTGTVSVFKDNSGNTKYSGLVRNNDNKKWYLGTTEQELERDTLNIEFNDYDIDTLKTNIESDFINNTGNITIGGTALINSDTTLDGRLTVNNNLVVYSNLIVQNGVNLNSYLNVTATATLNSVTIINNDATIKSNLVIGNNLDVTNNLVITGNTTISSEMCVRNNVTIEKSNTSLILHDTDASDGTHILFKSAEISNGRVGITDQDNISIQTSVSGDFGVSVAVNLQNNFNSNYVNDFVIKADSHNIGIGGISDPSERLHVNGSSIIESKLTVNDELVITGITTLSSECVVKGNTTIEGSLTVNGNLEVTGTTVVFNTENVNIEDSMMFIANGNTGNLVDIGMVGRYVDVGIETFSGLFRDADRNIWELFESADPAISEGVQTINIGNTLYNVSTLHANIEAPSLLVNGESDMNGELNMNNNTITNLSSPNNINDATNKDYVDTQIASIDLSTKLDKYGGTITNTLHVNGKTTFSSGIHVNGAVTLFSGLAMNGSKITNVLTPTDPSDGVNKYYVDQEIANASPTDKYDKTGGTITGHVTISSTVVILDYVSLQSSLDVSGALSVKGEIDMNSNKIINMDDPTAPTDAATKAYIDNAVIGLASGEINISEGGDITGDLNIASDMFIGGTLTVSGLSTFKSTINVTNNNIINVPNPSNNTDVANKQYVDSEISTSISTKYDVTGGTITGNVTIRSSLYINSAITLPNGPISSTDAVNKDYVDNINTSLSSSKYDKTGGTISGTVTVAGILSVNSNRIINVDDPIYITDATTKQYVDNSLNTLDTAKYDKTGGVISDAVTLYSTLSVSGQVLVYSDMNMNGGIIFNLDNPTLSHHVTRKQYVDDLVESIFSDSRFTDKYDKSGGVITGSLILNGPALFNSQLIITSTLNVSLATTLNDTLSLENNKIINVGTPADSTDAVNKVYVDSSLTTVINDVQNKYETAGGTITGNVSIDSNLYVTHTATIASSLVVNRHSTFNSVVHVKNYATISSTLHVATSLNTPIIFTSALTVHDNTTIENILTVNDGISTGTLTGNNITVNSQLTVTDTVTTTANVSGNTTLNGVVHMKSNVTIDNNLYIDGTLDVNSATNITANMSLDGTLNMRSNPIIEVPTPTTGQNFYATNKIYVDTIESSLDSAKFNKSGGTITGNTTIDANIDISGNLTLGGTLDVGNNDIINANLVYNAINVLNNNVLFIHDNGLKFQSVSGYNDASANETFGNIKKIVNDDGLSNLDISNDTVNTGTSTITTSLNVGTINAIGTDISMNANIYIDGDLDISSNQNISLLGDNYLLTKSSIYEHEIGYRDLSNYNTGTSKHLHIGVKDTSNGIIVSNTDNKIYLGSGINSTQEFGEVICAASGDNTVLNIVNDVSDVKMRMTATSTRIANFDLANDGSRFDIYTSHDTAMVLQKDNGTVCIGTADNNYPFYVGRTSTKNEYIEYEVTATGTNNTNANRDEAISIYTTGSILTEDNFVVVSDERVKENIEEVNEDEIMGIIRNLEPKKYDYIDKTLNKKDEIGLIAQEVETVYTNAVTNTRNALPNIMKNCDIVDNRIILETDKLKEGDEIRIIANDNNIDTIVIGIDENSIIVESNVLADKCFVYGTIVNDFKVLSRESLVPMLVSAIKYLDKEVSKLKNEN